MTSGALAALLGDAQARAPHEACGILLGDGLRVARAIACANIHPGPETHFEIDPQALIDAHRAARAAAEGAGAQVVGYYHSHPSGPPHPSATDRAMAPGDGSIWAIVAQGAISFWRDTAKGFEALSYREVDR